MKGGNYSISSFQFNFGIHIIDNDCCYLIVHRIELFDSNLLFPGFFKYSDIDLCNFTKFMKFLLFFDCFKDVKLLRFVSIPKKILLLEFMLMSLYIYHLMTSVFLIVEKDFNYFTFTIMHYYYFLYFLFKF